MHRNIVSITLNPSIDVTLWTDGLHSDEVNRVTDEQREVGGKGINVSRVVHSFGLETLCLSIAGQDNCKEFAGYLERESLNYEYIKVDGAVRENLTLRTDGQTIKLNRKGPALSSLIIGAMMALINSRVKPGDIVVFAGSLPERMSVEDYVELILAVKREGILVAIDSDIFTLEHYRRIAPWLIKPNIHELRHIIDPNGNAIDDIAAAAEKIRDAGVENTLVSLGGSGMLCIQGDRQLRVTVPRVEVKSTVGAGDSALAGFIVGYVKEYSLEDCVRLAAACGTACAMRDGTELASKKDANALLGQIQVSTL